MTADEVDVAQTRQPVSPPPGVPRVVACDGLAEEPVPVPPLGVALDVLCLHVRDVVDVRPQCGDRIDSQPHQVRWIEVQLQPECEHPLPQLGRVREVARIAVRVPSLHDAVLDHDVDTAGGRRVDQWREDLLGGGQVVRHRSAGVASDERSHRG